MAFINPNYVDRVRYQLLHIEHGSLQITEPEGWTEDEKEYARNSKYDGIVTKFSNSLKFVLDGAEYIEFVKEVFGVNAVIRLIKDSRNADTDRWERSYEGTLDLATYEKFENKVSVKFNSAGLERDFKARQSQKIEIDRTDTIDGGTVLPELPTKLVYLEGREILLRSKMQVSKTSNEAHTDVHSDAGNTRNQTCGLPLKADPNSHKEILKDVVAQTVGQEQTGDIDMMFLFDMNRDRTFRLNFSGGFNAFFQRYERIQWCFYQVDLVIYENGFDFDTKSRTTLFNLSNNFPITHPNGLPPADYDDEYPQFTKRIDFSYSNNSFTLLKGESASLEVYLKADMFFANNAGVRVFAQEIEVNMSIDEDSNYPATNTKAVLAHEMASRLTQIITNQDDVFYSEALGRPELGYSQDGDYALTGFAHGFYIRQFDKLPVETENKFKPITTSWKDFIESLAVTGNLSMGIEKFGFKERVVIEPKRYFYANHVTVKLPFQVQKLKRKESEKHYFSGLEVGFPRGGEYEEAEGLDEYNITASFTTVIVAVKNIFTKLTKYRTDSYGEEFTRRRPKSDNPTKDYRTDKHIFMFDLKRYIGDTIFKQRKWQDDFAEAPTGIFSPDTATKLRWSPFNLILRHGWVISAGLTKYPSDYIKYGSSEANSNLKTKLIGGNSYQESGKIINSELQKPVFVAETIEFEHEVTSDILKQVEGSTMILGRNTPNFYGLVEFKNDRNEIERGFLINLKPNKEGKWTLLKANR